MMTKKLKIVSILSACVWFLIAQCAMASTTIDKIVIFGDSLSDNGNLYSLTQKASKVIPFMPIIPKNPPYYEGRFSNGPVWVESLAIGLNVPVLDYAYGGSWAEPFHDSGLIVPFSLSSQVDMYMLSAVTDYDIGKHLFIIWTGGNDYLDGRSDVEYATRNVVNNIQSQIEWLAGYGAKNFLIMNLPDLAAVPRVMKNGSDSVANAAAIVKSHNKKLAKMVKDEKALYPDVKLVLADITYYMDDMIAKPAEYKLKNVTTACYKGGFYLADIMANREVDAAKQANIDLNRSTALQIAFANSASTKGSQICKNQDEYLFWDEIHPTAVVHRYVAMTTLVLLSESGISGPAGTTKTVLKTAKI